jgi:hypothetical protein
MMMRSRRMRWAGHVEHVVGQINAYNALIGRTERKKWPGKSRIRGHY